MRREPGEIEYWDSKQEEWVKNQKVCYVSDSQLCAKSGCNRKLKPQTSPRAKNPVNGRFCSHQCAADVRVGINEIEVKKNA